MKNMSLSLLHYSPTGGVRGICRQVGLLLNPEAAEYDLSRAMPQELEFTKDDAVLVAAPVFGGRLPAHAAQAVRHLSGHQTRAVPLVVFGNRNCAGSPLALGLDVSQVTVRDASSDAATHSRQMISGGTGVANLVSVEVSGYQFSSLVTFVVPNLTFNTIGATMFGPQP